MNESLNNLLSLIDDLTTIPSEKVTQFQTESCKKKPKKLLTKVKVDKNIINMVYGEYSPVFMIKCGVCKRENTWKEAARVGWIYQAKKMYYICTNCNK